MWYVNSGMNLRGFIFIMASALSFVGCMSSDSGSGGAATSRSSGLTDSSSSAQSAKKVKGPVPDRWLSRTDSGGVAGQDAYYADRLNTGLDAVDAPEAWAQHNNCESIKVAVVDSSIDVNHPDLIDNVVFGWDEVAGDYDPSPAAFSSLSQEDQYIDNRDIHGTHVAGIVAAIGNNSIGTPGMCWRASILAMKALDGRYGYVSDIIEAIEYADQQGAQIINGSWGISSHVQSLYDAMAARPHILFVVSAGNNGQNIDSLSYSPSTFSRSLPNVLTVASAQVSGNSVSLSYFSNYGVNTVKMAAPGGNITSTIPKSCDRSTGVCSEYAALSGTSMAAPYVTGAAALIWSDSPSLSAIDVKNKLISDSEAPAGNPFGSSVGSGKFLNIGNSF